MLSYFVKNKYIFNDLMGLIFWCFFSCLKCKNNMIGNMYIGGYSILYCSCFIYDFLFLENNKLVDVWFFIYECFRYWCIINFLVFYRGY